VNIKRRSPSWHDSEMLSHRHPRKKRCGGGFKRQTSIFGHQETREWLLGRPGK
jgi:hypothetical protein